MYGIVRYIFCFIWAMLHPQNKNVIGTKIENCSIPPFEQGVKIRIRQYRICNVLNRYQKGNETKSVILKQRTAKITQKSKKIHKITKSKKKSFPYLFLCALLSACNLLFLLSIFFAKYFFILSFFTFFLQYCKYRMPHAACGRVEFIYFLFRDLSLVYMPGNCGQWPSPWVK